MQGVLYKVRRTGALSTALFSSELGALRAPHLPAARLLEVPWQKLLYASRQTFHSFPAIASEPGDDLDVFRLSAGFLP